MGYINALAKQIAEYLSRSRRRTSGGKPAVRRRLLLEQLEERLVPTVVFVPNFAHETTSAGPYTVLNSPKVDLIFWGTYWGTAPGVQDSINLYKEAQNILNSPYYGGLTEYGTDGKVQVGNAFTDASSNPPSGYDPGALNVPANFSAAQAEVQFVLDNPQLSSLPIRGPGTSGDITQSPIYVVVSDAAHSLTNGGYNSAATYQSNGAAYPINLATFGVSSANDLPGFGLDFSHEVAERITDPTTNGVTVSYPTNPPSPGFPPFPSYLNNGGQIGDGEQEPAGKDHYNYQLNGATVQSFLSAAYGGDFIVPDGNSESIFLEPIWTTGVIPGSSPQTNGPVFTGNYDLFVTGYANTNVTIDAADALTTVNLNGQKFTLAKDGFGGGHIRNITVAPGIGENTINIQDLAADQTFTVLGNGADTVNVGNYYGSLQGIQGTVNITNAAHDTQLNVDDQTDAGFQYAYLSNAAAAADGDARGQITGLAPGVINYEYADTNQVNISTGKGGARVFVLATGTDTIIQTLYYATIEVGSSGSVQNIRGNLTVEGQSFALPMDLYVQDYSDAAYRTVTLSTGVVGYDSHGYDESPTGQISGLAPALISYEYGDTNSVTISTGTGGATVNVLATGASTLLQGNADNTTVNVGDAGNVQNIQGDLTIQNTPARTAINVDDFADDTYQNATLSTVTLANDFDGDNDSAGQISGLAPALITYEYIDTSLVTIYTGEVGATVNVLATGAATSLQGNALNFEDVTTVNIGDAGSVQNILGDLTIENQSGLTAVNVDDSTDAASRTVTLNTVTLADDGDGDSDAAGQISGLSASANITYEYFDTSGVTVRTGLGAVTVNVLATGVATSIVGNGVIFGDNTTVNVGDAGSVQNIQGDLTIQNSTAYTTVNVDDSTDAANPTVTLSTVTLPENRIGGSDAYGQVFGQITGLAPALINFEYFGASSIAISTGVGGATVNVLATGAATTLLGNAANTTVNIGDAGSVQNIQGLGLTIQNVPAHTAVNVDDSADLTFHNVTISTVAIPDDGGSNAAAGQISGLAPANIRYEYYDTSSIAINTGVGGATVNVLATGAIANVLAHGVATTLLGHSVNTTVNVGDAGSVQNIVGALTIENPPSYTTLNVDDSADPLGRTVTLSAASILAGQISGLAPALITYRYRDTASLTINGGGGGNTFVVSDVSDIFNGPAIILNTGAGNDVVAVSVSDVGGFSPLTINGQAGDNLLSVTGADSPVVTNTPNPNQAGAGTVTAAYPPNGPNRQIAYTNLFVAAAPAITGNPSNQVVTAGQTATFTASASGHRTPTVQWYVSTDGGATFNAIAGATSTTLNVTNVTAAMNGYRYEAVFTNASGSATTSAATLTVQATVSGVSVQWGAKGTTPLLTAADGLWLLPPGRNMDLPWLNIQQFTITLSQPSALTAADVHVTGITIANYGPVTITQLSPTSYVITLAVPIAKTGDRVTITIGNAGIATFTRRLDVLPGDFNDDGVVNSADLASVHNAAAKPYNVFADVNGDGVVDIVDANLLRFLIGDKLPL